MSNNAKIPWNTQKTPTKHVLRLFEKFLKIWFSAEKSGFRLRFRTMLKIPWNTQKTPTKHVLRLFKNFLKIWFSAQKSGSQPRCRTMLKQGKAEGFDSCDRPSILTWNWIQIINFWAHVTWKFDVRPKKNNRAPPLYYVKLCASSQSHRWIPTGVKVRKRSIWVKIGDFFPLWPQNLTDYLEKQ